MLKQFGIYWLFVDYHGHSKSSGIDGEERPFLLLSYTDDSVILYPISGFEHLRYKSEYVQNLAFVLRPNRTNQLRKTSYIAFGHPSLEMPAEKFKQVVTTLMVAKLSDADIQRLLLFMSTNNLLN